MNRRTFLTSLIGGTITGLGVKALNTQRVIPSTPQPPSNSFVFNGQRYYVAKVAESDPSQWYGHRVMLPKPIHAGPLRGLDANMLIIDELSITPQPSWYVDSHA